MKNEALYPELKYLMEHFHQDWKDQYSSDTSLLNEFARDNPSPVVEQVIGEIGRFTSANSDSHQIDRLFTGKWKIEPPYQSPAQTINWLKHAARVLQLRKTAAKNRPRKISHHRCTEIQRYPGLYLLICQFDRDWKSVYESETNLLKHFRRANAKKDLGACAGDIQRILRADHTDDDLDRILRKDFAGYPPYEKASEARTWLRHVLKFYNDVRPATWG